jgi:hypothetical protein
MEYSTPVRDLRASPLRYAWDRYGRWQSSRLRCISCGELEYRRIHHSRQQDKIKIKLHPNLGNKFLRYLLFECGKT